MVLETHLLCEVIAQELYRVTKGNGGRKIVITVSSKNSNFAVKINLRAKIHLGSSIRLNDFWVWMLVAQAIKTGFTLFETYSTILRLKYISSYLNTQFNLILYFCSFINLNSCFAYHFRKFFCMITTCFTRYSFLMV